MTEPPIPHAAFRLEHIVSWNPQVALPRSITIAPPVTVEEARQVVTDNLPALAVPPEDAGVGFGPTVVG
jgi:hypothetical protein